MSASRSSGLSEMMSLIITRPMIEYVVNMTIEVVDAALSCSSLHKEDCLQHSLNAYFPGNLSFTSIEQDPGLSISMGTWAYERVFLGALMVASKYTNDSSPKNVDWSIYSGVFGKRDVGRIEREFLAILHWELCLQESDWLKHAGLINVRQRFQSCNPEHERTANNIHSCQASTSPPNSPSTSSSSDQAPDIPITPDTQYSSTSLSSILKSDLVETHESEDFGLSNCSPRPILPIHVPHLEI
ncbi:hypothetical protein DL96DRAFT_1706554 [Flagelloscypha sp. PMI_526]|nr:hypothetical protein DL96DRAFT_1706554 [Flagelloscypha sp. PMI_526]